MKISYRPLVAAAVLALLAGCETMNQPAQQPQPAAPVHKDAAKEVHKELPPVPLPPPLPPARRDLNAGIDLYKAGDYNGAIKMLSGSADIWKADKPLQLDALKYMAFSYCVTNRQTLCRQQFQKALKLDPSFDLAPGEKGHPLWTPVFAKAKKS